MIETYNSTSPQYIKSVALYRGSSIEHDFIVPLSHGFRPVIYIDIWIGTYVSDMLEGLKYVALQHTKQGM